MFMQLFTMTDRQGRQGLSYVTSIDGQFIVAACVFIPNVSMPMRAEAIAVREGLELATRMSLSRVQADSDSTDIIDACKGDERWWN
jgi:hypothetical protein